jgi:predicted permease
MSWINRFIAVFRSTRLDAELNEELQFHLDSRSRDGMSPAEARRALGGYDRAIEASRDADRIRWVESASRDLRYALRTLRANPLFTLTAVFSLALGIGGNAAVFTLLRISLWKPLPVRHPEQIVQLVRKTAESDSDGSYSYVVFRQIRDAARRFGDVAATAGFGLRRFGTDGTSSERIIGEAVSGNYFSLLAVDPVLGRLIGPEDDRATGGNAVVVLSYRFWSRRFQADPSVIGRAVWYRESPYTVIGVASKGFAGVEAETEVDVWGPISAEVPKEWLVGPHYNWLRLLGRVRPGVNLAAMQGVLDSVFRMHMARDVLPRVLEPHRSAVAKHRLVVRRASSGIATTGRRYREPLLVLFGVVALVLLISCANVANLILARHAARAREFAVRMALGAGRMRITMQLLAESLLLAATGAAVGVVVAIPACRLLVSLLPQSTPPVAYQLQPDAVVFAFTATLAAVTAVLFGVAPALGATKIAWTSGTRATWRPRLGRVLVAGQLSVSVLLLIGAGLFLGTLRNIQAVDLGFHPRRLTTFNVSFPKGTPQVRARQSFVAIRESLERAPGIEGVTYSWPGLFTSGGWSTPVEREDGPAAPGNQEEVGALSVGPNFFAIAGMELLQGRYPTERETNPPVALINEKLSHHLFGAESPVGHRIRLPQNQSELREIIGVVRDANHYDVRGTSWKMVYLPGDREGSFLVRSGGDQAQTFTTIRDAVAAAGASAQIEKLGTVDDLILGTLGRERLVAALSTIFGVLATLLAVIGLYGVLAYSVSRRTAEMGIRMALGAQPSHVRRLVLGETATMLAAGIGTGLVVAGAATRLVSTLLYGIKPIDASVFAGAAAILGATAVLAAYLPARRASRIDPMVALRHE